MKKYLVCIIVLYSACQPRSENKASESDCATFKKGRFLYESQGDPTIFKIERTDSVQKEILGKTGEFINLKIRWTGPCTYELTFLDQHLYSIDSISASLQKSLKVKVEINNVRNDTCFVMVDDGSQKLPGIVYIDKK